MTTAPSVTTAKASSTEKFLRTVSNLIRLKALQALTRYQVINKDWRALGTTMILGMVLESYTKLEAGVPGS
jgi:hypothetical protein